MMYETNGGRTVWIGRHAGGWSWFTDPLTLEAIRLIPRGMMPPVPTKTTEV